MGMLMQGLRIKDDGHACLACLALVLMTQQVLVGDDVRPMMATRVMHAEQNLAEPGKAGERLQDLGRQ